MAIVIAIVHGMGSWSMAIDAELSQLFAWIGPGVGLAVLPMAFFLRQLIWKKGAGRTDAVVLQSFFAGNLAFQAMLEGAWLLNLTLWLITSDAMPYAAVTGVLILFGVAALMRSAPQS